MLAQTQAGQNHADAGQEECSDHPMKHREAGQRCHQRQASLRIDGRIVPAARIWRGAAQAVLIGHDTKLGGVSFRGRAG
jgi:hypothetical protein